MIIKKKRISNELNPYLTTLKVFFLAIMTNLVFWELFLRFFISSPCTQLPDRMLGYVNKPFARYVEAFEGYCQTRFNSLGFNDKEPSGDASTHIFVVGDSYTESFQVDKEDSYVQIAEDQINMYLGNQTVDLIKLGRDGFLPVHYPEVVNRYFDIYKPRIIILQFGCHSGYDFYSNQVAANYDQNGSLQELGARVRDEDLQKERFRFIINYSSMVYHSLRKYKVSIVSNLARFREIKNKILKKNKPSPSQSIETQRTLSDMAQRFGMILDGILQYNAIIVIIYINKPGAYFNESDMHQSDESYQALAMASAQRDLEIIDFSNDFRDFYLKNTLPVNGFANSLPGKGHLNYYGHSIVGSKLAECIAKNLTTE